MTETIDTPITSGLDAIREALRVRSTKLNYANLARDLGISVALLDGFRDGKMKLPDLALTLLVKDLFFGHLFYDPTTDKLKPSMKEPPKSLGIRPAFDLTPPQYQAGAAQAPVSMIKDANTVTQPRRLAWLERWWG